MTLVQFMVHFLTNVHSEMRNISEEITIYKIAGTVENTRKTPEPLWLRGLLIWCG